MAEDKNTSQVNMKIPGMKGGPRNRGAAVEKPVNGKETFMRLMQYFAKEIPVIIALFIAVVVMVVCSVYAPKLQSQAIDYISLRKFNNLNHILIFMLVVYIIYSICTFIQTRLSAILSQRIVKHMRQDLFDKIVVGIGIADHIPGFMDHNIDLGKNLLIKILRKNVSETADLT